MNAIVGSTAFNVVIWLNNYYSSSYFERIHILALNCRLDESLGVGIAMMSSFQRLSGLQS